MWRFCLIAALLMGVSATPHGPVDAHALFAARTPFQDALHAVERIQTDLDGVQYRLGLAYLGACLGDGAEVIVRTQGAAAIMDGFESRHKAAIARVWSLAESAPDVPPIRDLADWLSVLLVDAERLRADTALWTAAASTLNTVPIMEWKALFDALLEAEPMSLPDAGYDLITITNPTGDVTDFPFFLDSHNLSASWHADCNTTDGTRARFAIDESATEIPFDPIYYDDGDWLFRFKHPSTIGTTGTFRVRVYAPNTRNTAYAENDTYGAQNAYASHFQGRWPLMGDFLDRTSNNLDGTGQGGISAGGTAGKFGVATVFDGSDDHITLGDVLGGITRPQSFSAWVKTSATLGTYLGMRDGVTTQWQYFSNSSGALALNGPSGINSTTAHHNGAWRHIAASVASNGTVTFYLDGASDGSAGTANPSDQNIAALIGARYATAPAVAALFNGAMQDLQISSAALTGAWIAYDYAQTSDNATFWGTPTWVPGGSVVPIAQYYRRMRAN
jgi:hypothetical protein